MVFPLPLELPAGRQPRETATVAASASARAYTEEDDLLWHSEEPASAASGPGAGSPWLTRKAMSSASARWLKRHSHRRMRQEHVPRERAPPSTTPLLCRGAWCIMTPGPGNGAAASSYAVGASEASDVLLTMRSRERGRHQVLRRVRRASAGGWAGDGALSSPRGCRRVGRPLTAPRSHRTSLRATSVS